MPMPYALAANVSVHHAPCVLVLAKVCLDVCVNTQYALINVHAQVTFLSG